MANWWEDAPLATNKKQEDNWWEDAPLAESLEESAPVEPIPTEITPAGGGTYKYKKPVEVPDFTPEEIQQANEPMRDLSGAPIKSAFGDEPNPEPVGNTTHTVWQDAEGNFDDVLKGVLDDKGDITTASYNKLTFDQAMEVYNGLLQHPDTKLMKNQAGVEVPVFRGHRIPFPEPALFPPDTKVMNIDIGGAGPSMGSVYGEGGVSQITNIAQFALSAVDKLAGTNISPSLEYPQFKPGSVGDSLVADAPGMIVGGLAGRAVAGAAIKGSEFLGKPATELLKKAPAAFQKTDQLITKTGNAVTRAAGFEVGATAGLDENLNGIISGDDPLLGDNVQDLIREKTFLLMDTDAPGMTETEKTFAKKMNQTVDSFISGNVISVTGKIFGKGLKLLHDSYIRDLGPALSEVKRAEVVNNKFMSDLGNLSENATGEERKEVARRAILALDKGQEYFKTLKDTNTGEIVEVDPLAAILKGAEILGDKELAQNAITLRSNIMNAELTAPEIKQKSYQTDVIDPFKNDIYDSRGGAAGVEQTRSGIVKSGQEEIGTSRMTAEAADFGEEQARQSVIGRIENDPFVGETLKRFKDKSNIDINQAANESTEALAREGQKAEQFLYNKRNDAYDKLPDNVSVDRESWNGLVYKKADDETTSALDKSGKVKELPEPKFVDGLTKKMKDIIESSGGRLKTLHNDLVPQLTAEITRLSKTPQGQSSEALFNLRAIKDNILRDQLDILIKKGGAGRQKFYDQLLATRKESQEYYDLFGKGAPLESIRKANTTRDLAAMNPGVASENLRNTGETIRNNIATGPQNRDRTVALDKAIRDTGGDTSKLLDYYKAKVTDKLRATTQGDEGLLGINSEQIRQAVQEDISNMGAIDPASVTQLQKLLADVDSGKIKITKATAEADAATAAFKTDASRVQNEQAGFFNPKTGQELSEGQQVFNNAFDNPSDLTPLDNAIKRAEERNELSGLQAAFGRKLKDTPLKEVDITDPKNRTMEIAEKLFRKDAPEVIDGIREAYELARITGVTKGNRTGPLAAVADVDKGYKATIRKLIQLKFGTLNTTATRAQNIGGVFAENTAKGEDLKNIIGLMASNPKEFKEMVKKFNKGDMFTPENKRLFSAYMGRASTFDGVLIDKSRIDTAWEDAQTQEAMGEEPPEDAKPVKEASNYKPGDTLRPLSKDEYRQNDDGSYSTELEVTVETPDGKVMNVPSLWMKGREGWVELESDDEIAEMAARWEKQTGKKFPRFNSIAEAEKAAKARSESGGIANGDLSQ